MKAEVKRSFDLSGVSEDVVNVMISALEDYSGKKKDARLAKETASFLSEMLGHEIRKITTKLSLEDLGSIDFGTVFAPYEFFDVSGPLVRFIMGKSGQLNISKFEKESDLELLNISDSMWINSECANALLRFLESGESFYSGYINNTGKRDALRTFKIYRNSPKVEIQKDDSWMVLQEADAKCLEAFLRYHYDIKG